MIVATLITLFALWLVLTARGRARIAETARSRPGYGLWLVLGFALLMVCFWGMTVPGWRGAVAGGVFGPTEVWRVAGAAFLAWVAVSGAAMLWRGRL
jgi:hypothetical protein